MQCAKCGGNDLYLRSEELYGAEFKEGKISLTTSYGEEYKSVECRHCGAEIFGEDELAEKEIEYNF